MLLQWVKIELLATVGWKWGCQPFSCRCSQNMTHCRKEICSTCLSKCQLSIRSPCLLWNQSLQSLLYQKREVPESCSTLHQQCTMVASCLQKRELRYPRFGLLDIDCDLGCFTYATLGDCWKSMKNCRDWAFSNTGFGSGAASLSAADHGVVVSKICYVWLCSQLCYQTAANPRTVVEIELLAIVGWKWGCQPFSCPCSQNMTHCRKEICSTCLSKC